MKEILMYYHLNEDIKKIICIIMEQLGVQTIEIKDTDIHQTMGYLLNIPGFNKSKITDEKPPKDSFLFFAGMADEQMELVLELFKNAGIPFIPYKAMLTNDNIAYYFYDLYRNVENEYLSLTNQS